MRSILTYKKAVEALWTLRDEFFWREYAEGIDGDSEQKIAVDGLLDYMQHYKTVLTGVEDLPIRAT